MSNQTPQRAETDRPDGDAGGERTPRAVRWSTRWVRAAAVLAVILFPVAAYLVFEAARSAPLTQPITVATSQQDGRHDEIASNLVESLESEKLNVAPMRTFGSYHNLFLLQAGVVDFAIYQAGTGGQLSDTTFDSWDAKEPKNRLTLDEILQAQTNGQRSKEDEVRTKAIFARLDFAPKDGFLNKGEFSDTSMIRCVATLYPEVVHFIVRKDAGIEKLNDLRGKVVALGQPRSGSYAMSRLLLAHSGITESELQWFEKPAVINKKAMAVDNYARLKGAFQTKRLDAAFITIGVHSKLVDDLLQDEALGLELRALSSATGLSTKNVLVIPFRIPPGTYPNQQQVGEGTPTIAVKAQLITRKGVNDNVVRKVTEIVMSQKFLLDNNLRDLATESQAERYRVAQESLEFKLHRAAVNFYSPDAFDPEEFQNWEALYSLLASIALGVFIVSRWLVQRGNRRTERQRESDMQVQKDRLDKFLEQTIAIERAQIDSTDLEELGRCLDDVTRIKLEALAEFTNEDLRSDRTFSIFLMQCANLINKIQLKIIAYATSPETTRSVAGQDR